MRINCRIKLTITKETIILQVNLYIERTQKRLKLLKGKQLEDEAFISLFEELSGEN